MKFELKKSAFNDVMDRCIQVGYGQGYYLFSGIPAIGYTHGQYGWNADIYGIDILGNDCHDVSAYFIVTGYRTFGWRKAPRKVTEKYEKLAEEAVKNRQGYLLPELRMKWLSNVLYPDQWAD